MNNNKEYNLYATAAFGLEGIVGAELKRLKMQNVRAELGGARFTGTLTDAFLCNLRLRSADRVLIVLAEDECRTFEELFQLVKSIAWEDIMPADAKINVSGKCVRSQLMSVRDCQAITKKAIIERLKAATHRAVFTETGAVYPIDVAIHSDRVRITLDTSGEALNRRGYRTWNGEAPLRETLAASLVELSPWRPGMRLYDPCCGTGTLLIEAAFIALNRAPGLRRPFAMEKWPFADVSALERVRREAQSRSDEGQQREIRIAGSDIDPEAIELARRHIRQAGLGGRIEVEVMDMRDVVLKGEPGAIVANPPYGERIGDRRVAHVVARQLGELSRRCPGWNVYAFSADMGFEREFGRRADRRRRFYNGRIECEYHMFENGTPAQNGGAHTRGGRK